MTIEFLHPTRSSRTSAISRNRVFVKRRQNHYLLTRTGRDELSIATAVARLLIQR